MSRWAHKHRIQQSTALADMADTNSRLHKQVGHLQAEVTRLLRYEQEVVRVREEEEEAREEREAHRHAVRELKATREEIAVLKEDLASSQAECHKVRGEAQTSRERLETEQNRLCDEIIQLNAKIRAMEDASPVVSEMEDDIATVHIDMDETPAVRDQSEADNSGCDIKGPPERCTDEDADDALAKIMYDRVIDRLDRAALLTSSRPNR